MRDRGDGGKIRERRSKRKRESKTDVDRQKGSARDRQKGSKGGREGVVTLWVGQLLLQPCKELAFSSSISQVTCKHTPQLGLYG